ncbi:hypothetical protein AAFF_G00121820 [Aldrovandia affinis]|uniref:Uncharacterized protein n=1 Tax=Aldrovandia affinis TaxID=143900 RepID=A0AAD7RSB5_9TELE|nr:hypothetical protein AAFF_G00121820 [Aldrovandia affinis]
MGTFNACTVREEARLVELAHCAEERGVEILGTHIQEHRRVHTDDRIVYRRVERSTFITASAWRNEAQAATGGVGLMLGSLARKALRRVYHHTDRILIAEFSGNPVTTVIVVYSPTNVAPPEEVEKFYEDLATAVRDVPAHNFLAILGDFNARLGPEDARFPYHDSTKPQWRIPHCPSHGTRATAGEHHVPEKNRQEMDLPRPSLSTFSSVGSDHRVVSMRVRLSLRVPKPSPRIRYDWKALSTDPGLQARYTEEVRSRFQLLDEGLEPSSEYRQFVVANEEATRLCVPVLDKTRTSLQSRPPDVVVARGRVEEARLGYVREPTVERRGILNEAKQLLFSTYNKIKGEELMERVQRVQAAQGERQYGEAWRVINEMTGRKRTKEGQVEGHSPEERVVTWFNHFRRLLGTTAEGDEEEIPSFLQNLNIDDGPFTTSEFARAKTTLREGKSAGPDGIPPEVLKNCGLNNIILQFCNLALLSNKQPDMWSLSNIIPCSLFRRQTRFLGHVVSEMGVSTDPAKVEVVEKWLLPTSTGEVRSFLGLASYYRRFIAGFANIAHPLHQLTEKRQRFTWSPASLNAFDHLHKALITTPILLIPDLTKPFLLDTDASNNGVGAVLSQASEDVNVKDQHGRPGDPSFWTILCQIQTFWLREKTAQGQAHENQIRAREEAPELSSEMEISEAVTEGSRLRERFKKCVALRGVTGDSWTEENNQALDKFSSDTSIRTLIVYLDPSTGLQVDYTLPAEQVEEQIAYFIRTEEVFIMEENFERVVHYGRLWCRAMEQLLWFLNGVHVPLVTLSIAWPESIKNNYSANLHRFLTNLTDTRFKLEGKTVLYIPMEALQFKPEVAAKDKELVQRMEVVMIHWTRQIKEVLNAQETLEAGESSGPLEEISFWRSRCLDLTGISHQLEKPGVSHVQAILQLCKSTYIPAFCKLTKHIQESSLQAQSNVTFLSLLREPCEELACLKPREVAPKLAHILNLVRFIWINSKFYNTRERLISLFRKLTNDIIRLCCREISLDRIFKGYVVSSKQTLTECIQCCLNWKEMYFHTSQLHHKYGSSSCLLPLTWAYSSEGWVLSPTSIFALLDAFVQRCEDLLEVCDCQKHFARREEGAQVPLPCFQGRQGEELTRSLLEIESAFESCLQTLSEGGRSILDVKNTTWHDEYNLFRAWVKDLEVMMQNLLCKAFETVNTVEEGIQLLDVFYHLSAREVSMHLSLREIPLNLFLRDLPVSNKHLSLREIPLNL